MKHLSKLCAAVRLAAGCCLVVAAGKTQAQAPAPGWQAALATAGGNALVTATAADQAGNVYLTGSFSGAATFGATTLTSSGGTDVFVAKWTAAGGFNWALQGSGSDADAGQAITLDGGSVFVAGRFASATLTLGSTTLTNAGPGKGDIFVARLAEAGGTASFAWGKQAGGPGEDAAYAISSHNYVTADDNPLSLLYVGGVAGGAAQFSTASGAVPFTYQGGFVISIASQGNAASFNRDATPAGSLVTALAVSSSSLYAAGTFGGSASTIGPNGHTLSSAGQQDAFVAKFQTTYGKNLPDVWAQRAGGPGNDVPQALTLYRNNVYVAGKFDGATAAFGSTTLANAGAAGTPALFAARLTDVGSTAPAFDWALGAAGSGSSQATGVAATGTSVYLAGSFGGSLGLGSTTLSSVGGTDVLLAKLTDGGSSASVAWAQRAGGSGDDVASGLARNGPNLYAGGQLTGPAAFGSQTIGAAGTRPGFVAAVLDPAPLLLLAAPSRGPAGSVITLYGNNLAGTTAVTFAGSSGNVVTTGFSVNAAGTQLSGVVVPAGAQSGTLNVTTPRGTSNGLVTFAVAPANSAPAWQTAQGTYAGINGYFSYAAPAADGNVIVAGYFSGTQTFGSTTLTSTGGSSVVIAKLNPATRNYLWAQQISSSSPSANSLYGLVANGSSIYLAGWYEGTSVTLGPTTLTNTSTDNRTNGYVTKLTDAGSSASFTWTQAIESDGTAFVESLAVSGNSVYVGGDFEGASLTIGRSVISSNASNDDGFVAKLTDQGSTASAQWIAAADDNTGGYVNFYALAVSGSTVYAGGLFNGSVTLGSSTITSPDRENAVVARLVDNGTSGTFTGAVQSSGPGLDGVNSMVSTGNAVYLAASSSGATSTWGGTTLTHLSGPFGVVAKVSDTAAGLAIDWAQQLGGSTGAWAYQVAARGHNVYATGYFGGTMTLGSTTLTSAGSGDIYVAHFVDQGSSASVSWVQQAGGIGPDTGYGIALNGSRVFVAGITTPPAAFGSLVVATPYQTPVAVLATIDDATSLATQPVAVAAKNYLYPNPAHGSATLQLPAGAGSVALLDALGREVRRYAVPAGATELVLDLRGVPAGLYIVQGAGSSRKLAVE